jgi:hypothetical protein
MQRSLATASKELGVNHVLENWLVTQFIRISQFSIMESSVMDTKALGTPRSLPHFGISYSRIR